MLKQISLNNLIVLTILLKLGAAVLDLKKWYAQPTLICYNGVFRRYATKRLVVRKA